MTEKWIQSALCLALLTASVAADPQPAQNAPSFDCRKAGSAAEKTICANPDLAKLDKQLASQYRSLIRSFSDEDQVGQIKLDQKNWLAARNACDGAAECIGQTYRKRIGLLSGEDRDYPAAGVFESKDDGALALYPLSGKYLVSIQTAEQKNATWTCEVTGHAAMDSGALRVTFGAFSFPVMVRDARTMVIAPGKEVSAAAANACGLNGTFAFTYTRSAPGEIRSAR